MPPPADAPSRSLPTPRPPRPFWVVLTACCAVLGVIGFALVTLAIYGHGPLLEVDVHVQERFARHRVRWLIHLLDAETQTAAYVTGSAVLLLVASVVAVVERAWRPLLMALTAVALLGISVGAGKQMIGRSRIPFAVDTFGAGGTSYPSGHTTTAVVVSGSLVLLFARRMSQRVRRLLLVAVAGYSLVTGFSRIYLHDHWFTDVLAGWFLGTAIVCLVALMFLRQPSTRA